MKIQQHTFHHDVELYNLGDIHIGNENCNIKFLKKIIAEIEANPNAHWVSTGDLLEVATTSSVSSTYKADSLQTELDRLCVLLKPIAKKCLGFVASNHHRRLEKETGLSLDCVVANQLRVPFLGITGVVDITVGRGSYYCVLHHGVGGGAIGNKVARAMKLAQNFQGADVYLSGHTHGYSHIPFYQNVIDRKRHKTTNILSHIIVTAHFLDYKGSYAEEMGLTPSPVGCSKTTLKLCKSGNQKDKLIISEFVGA